MELGAGTKGLSDKMTVEQDVRLCNQAKYCSTQVAAQNLVLLQYSIVIGVSVFHTQISEKYRTVRGSVIKNLRVISVIMDIVKIMRVSKR